MDFSQRTTRPAPSEQSSTPSASKSKSKQARSMGSFKVISVILLYSITVLIVALAMYAFRLDGRAPRESKQIATGNYQAVFLNGGQVYFGKIASVNQDYMVLSDIYYLRVNQQVQPGQQAQNSDVSLVKLGCELHGPQDQMVIKQDQVMFWENLKTDGQVAKAVKQFQEQNPNGLTCETPKTEKK